MAAPIAERVVEVVHTIAPIVFGIGFVVLGLVQDFNLAMIGLGAGLLGVPGITEAVKSILRG